MNSSVVAQVACALGLSILAHAGCTAADRTYADNTTAGSGGAAAGSGGVSGSAGSGAGTGGAGGDTGGSSGSTGTAGSGSEAGAPPGCSKDNDPCEIDAQHGLCLNGSCRTCIDVTDDANCKTAYGPAHLCLQGNCVGGDCRSNTDCTGGKVCTNNSCVKCTADADCGDPAKICNTGTGACVGNAQCTGVASFGVCPVNAADHCCAGVCSDMKCCADADCNDPNQTCVSGQCKLKNCLAPTNGDVYVNPTAAALGSGGSACPFQTLFAAFNYVKANPGTYVVHVDGNVTASTEAAQGGAFPYTLPAGVSISGSGVTASVIESDVGKTCLTMSDAGAHTVSNVTIQQKGFVAMPPTTEPSGSGIAVSAGSLLLDHAVVQGFDKGVYVAAGAFATIGAGVTVQYNWWGADDGGGDLKVTVPAAPATHFDYNVYGVWTLGAALVQISGADINGQKTIFASHNARAGVRVFSSATAGDAFISGSSIDNMAMNNNQGAVDGYAGIYIYAGTRIKVSNCNMINNVGAGIKIVPNGTDTVANINLGTASSHGNNVIQNNTPDLCLGATVGTLHAQFNTFDATVCATGTTAVLSPPNNCTTISRTGVEGGALASQLDLAPCAVQ